MSRPSLMTPERVAGVLAGIKLGQSRTQAGRAAGVTHQTIARWAERVPSFAAQLDQAEAEGQQLLLKIVVAAAAKNLPNTWQAAAWLLERRWPNDFGQKSRLDVSIDLQAEIHDLAERKGLDVGEVMAMAEAIIREHVAEKGSVDLRGHQ
jgi:hypothetical protein